MADVEAKIEAFFDRLRGAAGPGSVGTVDAVRLVVLSLWRIGRERIKAAVESGKFAEAVEVAREFAAGVVDSVTPRLFRWIPFAKPSRIVNMAAAWLVANQRAIAGLDPAVK